MSRKPDELQQLLDDLSDDDKGSGKPDELQQMLDDLGGDDDHRDDKPSESRKPTSSMRLKWVAIGLAIGSLLAGIAGLVVGYRHGHEAGCETGWDLAATEADEILDKHFLACGKVLQGSEDERLRRRLTVKFDDYCKAYRSPSLNCTYVVKLARGCDAIVDVTTTTTEVGPSGPTTHSKTDEFLERLDPDTDSWETISETSISSSTAVGAAPKTASPPAKSTPGVRQRIMQGLRRFSK